jgi:hypothetical protein
MQESTGMGNVSLVAEQVGIAHLIERCASECCPEKLEPFGGLRRIEVKSLEDCDGGKIVPVYLYTEGSRFRC